MSWRVTTGEVKQIIETTLSEPEILAYVQAANITVTKILGEADLTADQLTEIERWLTAHLIACTREQQATDETSGGASITYQGETGKGLDATHYGQMVKILDTTGLLAKSEKSKLPASIYAVKSFS